MSSEQTQEYDDALVTLLELVWGDGFLSPGGPNEIRKIFENIDLGGTKVLDVGCGTGGIDQFIVETFGPDRIVGVDVEQGLIDRANKRAVDTKLTEQLSYECVEPGPLPFENASFDVVFSKDAMVHIADKEALFAEIFRVLRPSGILVASDWMCGSDEPFSEQMAYYVEAEGLGFGMASPARYASAMTAAGFTDIEMADRNSWYKPLVQKEYDALSGPLKEKLFDLVGEKFAGQQIEVWRALKVVVDSGELRPGHMRARKPDSQS